MLIDFVCRQSSQIGKLGAIPSPAQRKFPCHLTVALCSYLSGSVFLIVLLSTILLSTWIAFTHLLEGSRLDSYFYGV